MTFKSRTPAETHRAFSPWALMVASRRYSLRWFPFFCGKNKLWVLDCNTTCGENGIRGKAISLLSLFFPPDCQVLLDPHVDAKNSQPRVCPFHTSGRGHHFGRSLSCPRKGRERGALWGAEEGKRDPQIGGHALCN